MIEISLKVLISERRRPRSLGAATCEKIGVGRSGFDFVSHIPHPNHRFNCVFQVSSFVDRSEWTSTRGAIYCFPEMRRFN